MEKFNQKYVGLNDRQKDLLREYIYNVSNSVALRTYATNMAKDLVKEIKLKSPRLDNKITKIKSTTAGKPREHILLTANCCKRLCFRGYGKYHCFCFW